MGQDFREWLNSILLTIAGLIFMLWGISTASSISKFKENAEKTIGHVSYVKEEYTDYKEETKYDIEMVYMVNGEEYKKSYSSDYPEKIGTEKTIYYDKNNPENIRTNISVKFEMIISILGILFGLIGVKKLVSKVNVINRKNDTIKSGDKIYAELQEVIIDYSYSSNDRYAPHPYIIICVGEDNITGEIRTFKSDNIWYNPKIKIQEKNIKKIPVYIDKKNRDKYYVSLEEFDFYE